MRDKLRQAYGRTGSSQAGGIAEAVGHLSPEQLVDSHAGLVRKLARRYARATGGLVELDDLYSVGIIGLLQAQKTYEPKGGRPFPVFAEFRVRGAMLDELRRRDPMSQPLRRKARGLQAAVKKLTDKFQRPPTEQELAEHMEMDLSSLQSLRRDVQERRAVQFEETRQVTDLRSMIARSSMPQPQLRLALIQAVQKLPERLQQIIGLYYYQDMGLKEIGKILGVTEARVCQLHKQAVEKLRVVFDDD